MSRSDVSVAEKFRKVMEAYQIEMDYGSSVENYTQSLELEGLGIRDYNMLRIGRVGCISSLTMPRSLAGGMLRRVTGSCWTAKTATKSAKGCAWPVS